MASTRTHTDRPTRRPDDAPARTAAGARRGEAANGRRVRRVRVRRTMSADAVWKGTVVALATFVVLGSGSMVRSAEGMPLGWQRSVAVAVTGAIDRVANFLSLNRPYDWAAGALGLERTDADFEFPEERVPPPADDAPGATTTTTTLPPVRVPTAEEPLRVLVAGDSTAKSLGESLAGTTADRPELQVDIQGEISTGLARFDYFNWGVRLAQLLEENDPEVVLFMVGANDGQSIIDGDGTIVAQFDDPDWADHYRRRVAGIMDLVEGGPRRLIWVGEPDVGAANVQRAVRIGNQLAEEEAARRPWVTYFDVASIVAGEDGGYAEFITLPDGSTARCYASDGVHLSVRCLARVMEELVPEISSLYDDGVSRSGP